MENKIKMFMVLASILVLVLPIISPAIPIRAEEQEVYVLASLRSDLITMNPFMQTLIDESNVMELVYDTLFRQAPNGSFIPWLAESVDISENGTVWTFHIRRNVKWHDGTPLTAEDVAFTLNLIVEKRFPSRSNVFEAINRTELIDDYTVRVYLNYPYAAFAPALSFVYIVQKAKWENVEDPFTYSNFENPIGTGPFKWVERVAGDYVKLAANKDYWAGAPKIDGVIFKIYQSSDAAYMAVDKGEIDAMNNLFIPPHLISQAEEKVNANPALRLHFRKPVYFQYITCPLWKYPFSIKEFREALLYAINVSAIIDVVYNGHADPGSLGTMPPVFGEMPENWYKPGLEKEVLYPFNLDTAKSILDSLNFIDRDGDGIRETPNGTKLEFSMLASSIYPDRIRIAELVRDWWNEIGVKVNVDVLDHRTVVSTFLSHDFDLIVIGIWLSEPDDWYLILHSSGAVVNGFNTAEYKNSEVDALLEQQRAEVNIERRRQLLWEMQEKVAQDIPYLSLVHIHEAYMYRVDKVTGWVTSTIFPPGNFWSYLNLQPATPTTPATATTPATGTTPTEETAPAAGVPLEWIGVGVVAVIIIAVVAFIVLRRK